MPRGIGQEGPVVNQPSAMRFHTSSDLVLVDVIADFTDCVVLLSSLPILLHRRVFAHYLWMTKDVSLELSTMAVIGVVRPGSECGQVEVAPANL